MDSLWHEDVTRVPLRCHMVARGQRGQIEVMAHGLSMTRGRRGHIIVMSCGLSVTRGHHMGAIAMSHEDGGDT